MEEIEYKLNQNNALATVQAISKLIELIKVRKTTPSTDTSVQNDSDLNFPELLLLKSKCGVEEPTVSLTASHGIVSLVEDGVLPPGSTLSDLMVILSSAKCYSGVTMAICSLLLLDLRRALDANKVYKCPFSIQKPQHPLISLLIQNGETWPEVFSQIQTLTTHCEDKIVANSFELFRPVFFYIMCDPAHRLRDTVRRQLWNHLLHDNNPQTRLVTYEILSWIQLNSKQKCLEVCDHLTEVFRLAGRNTDTELCALLVIFLTATVHRLVGYGGDPNPCIATITEMLTKPGLAGTHSVLLMMLANTLTTCSSVYLTAILQLCKVIVLKQSASVLAVKCTVVAILQWLLYPSNLIRDALQLAHEILLFTDNNHTYGALTGSLFRNTLLQYVRHADPHIDVTLKLCLMAEKWHTDEKQLVDWLTQVSRTPAPCSPKLFTFVSAIFVHGFDRPQVRLTALDILLQLVARAHGLAPNMLVLMLHTLSAERCPEVQVALLQALPGMAVLKQNVALIVSTLETVKQGPGCLKTLALGLYHRLWRTEVRCYPFLQKLLAEPDGDWEFSVARVCVLKEICEHRAALHGKEMVSYLSQVLNKQADQKGALASSVAIQGIAALCEAGIIDVLSTYKSIAPRFYKDKRPVVVKSFCGFLAEFANVRVTSHEQQNAVTEVVSRLWQYVAASTNGEIIRAALHALACFAVEQISLKQLPAPCRQHLKLPKEYAKTPVDAARKPEDVLPYIPGVCWAQLLQTVQPDALPAAGDMLVAWLRAEVAEYGKAMYSRPDVKAEAPSYEYLPPKSIVRGLANYVRLATLPESSTEFHELAVRQSLRVLGEPYAKPLPPVNWSFLRELVHTSPDTARLALNVACKQVIVSDSARQLVQDFVGVFQPTMDKSYEMAVLFANLGALCKGIAPNVLRPMLSKSLQTAHGHAAKTGDCELYAALAGNVQHTLLLKDIHDANRTLLSQIVATHAEELDANTPSFDALLPCIVATSSMYIERLSSPSLWWDTTPAKLTKAVKIRCAVARASASGTPLLCLNECVTSASLEPSVQIYTLTHVLEVFRLHAAHPSTGDWLLELMRQIQELAAEAKGPEETVFLCDVLLLAVIVFAGHECLYSPVAMCAVTKEARLALFPHAVYRLVHATHAAISVQIMDWLHHMAQGCVAVPASYQLVFCTALTMLRHEKSFSEPSKWMKYVSVKRPAC